MTRSVFDDVFALEQELAKANKRTQDLAVSFKEAKHLLARALSRLTGTKEPGITNDIEEFLRISNG